MHYMLGTPATNSLRLKIGHPKRKRSSNHPFSGLLLVSSREGRQSWYITCMIFACSRVFAEFLTAKGKLKTTQSKDLSRNRCPQGSPGFPWRDVSENSGTPKSSILIEFSIINHPFWGTPIFGNTHMVGSRWGINSFFSVFSGHFVGRLTLEVSSWWMSGDILQNEGQQKHMFSDTTFKDWTLFQVTGIGHRNGIEDLAAKKTDPSTKNKESG